MTRQLMQWATNGREPLGANSCESNLAFTAPIAIQKMAPTLPCYDMKTVASQLSNPKPNSNKTEKPQLVALAKCLWCDYF